MTSKVGVKADINGELILHNFVYKCKVSIFNKMNYIVLSNHPIFILKVCWQCLYTYLFTKLYSYNHVHVVQGFVDKSAKPEIIKMLTNQISGSRFQTHVSGRDHG